MGFCGTSEAANIIVLESTFIGRFASRKHGNEKVVCRKWNVMSIVIIESKTHMAKSIIMMLIFLKRIEFRRGHRTR